MWSGSVGKAMTIVAVGPPKLVRCTFHAWLFETTKQGTACEMLPVAKLKARYDLPTLQAER
jgi:hypothetical protein